MMIGVYGKMVLMPVGLKNVKTKILHNVVVGSSTIINVISRMILRAYQLKHVTM